MREDLEDRDRERVPLISSPSRDQWEVLLESHGADLIPHTQNPQSEQKALATSIQCCESDIPKYVISQIMKRGDFEGAATLDYEEFISIVKHPDFEPVFQNLMHRYVYSLVPRRPWHFDVSEQGVLHKNGPSCWPPPIAMILISLVAVILYCIDAFHSNSTNATGPIALALVYDPKKRYQVWRYFSYMFVHFGVFHLTGNMAAQITLGLCLEMTHRWWKVVLIYLAGVLAGSLGTSMADPSAELAGASGGGYALFGAHISTIITNWKETEYALFQLIAILIVAALDTGTAAYSSYYLSENEHIGYTCHFAGAAVGLLLGMNILGGLNVTNMDKVVRWASIALYCLLMGTAIIWNVACKDCFPHQIHET